MPKLDTILTAQYVFDNAPLGAVVRFSDGTPRPPDRFKNKLRAWKSNNGDGMLVEKTPASDRFPATIKLHTGDFGSSGIVVMRTYVCYLVTDPRRFEIASVPPAGTVRILDCAHKRTELQHLAPDIAAAQRWIADNNGSGYELETVTA